MIQIDKSKLIACSNVLSKASKIETFFEENKTNISKLSECLCNINNAIPFSFNISLSNNGESIHSEFGFDGVKFFIFETNHSYEPEVGGDTFTSYEFTQGKDVYEENGDISSWENNAIEMLDYVGNESPKAEINISFEEE